MKRKILMIVALLTCILLVGCGKAPEATLSDTGEETILYENIVVEDVIEENIITWDNVPTQTW